MFTFKLKSVVSMCVVLILLTGIVSTSFAANFDFYNIDDQKGYTNPTPNEIREIEKAFDSGKRFAKKIGGKLVDFNAYYEALTEKFLGLLDGNLSEEEAIDALIDSIFDILNELEEIKTEEASGDLEVIDIY